MTNIIERWYRDYQPESRPMDEDLRRWMRDAFYAGFAAMAVEHFRDRSPEEERQFRDALSDEVATWYLDLEGDDKAKQAATLIALAHERRMVNELLAVLKTVHDEVDHVLRSEMDERMELVSVNCGAIKATVSAAIKRAEGDGQ